MNKTIAILVILLAVIYFACQGLITLFFFFFAIIVSTPMQSKINVSLIPPTNASFVWAIRNAKSQPPW